MINLFLQLRTVYYEMTENNENCHFDLSIDIHERVPNSDGKFGTFVYFSTHGFLLKWTWFIYFGFLGEQILCFCHSGSWPVQSKSVGIPDKTLLVLSFYVKFWFVKSIQMKISLYLKIQATWKFHWKGVRIDCDGN